MGGKIHTYGIVVNSQYCNGQFICIVVNWDSNIYCGDSIYDMVTVMLTNRSRDSSA